MKFIAEPVKYKQRLRWKVEDPFIDGGWSMGDPVYWDKTWGCSKARKLGFAILRVPNVGYFLSPNDGIDDPRKDIGPYPTLATVKAAAETMILLGHQPKWIVRRREVGF